MEKVELLSHMQSPENKCIINIMCNRIEKLIIIIIYTFGFIY